MQPFGERLWIRDGPTVSFLGFPYPTRMAVARLEDGGLWVWSPVALDDALAAEVTSRGAVRHLVAPNKFHHLFLSAWQARWPEASLWAPPGLPRRRPDLRFDRDLEDGAPEEWRGEIEAVVFGGSFVMNEVVFFHRPSRTALVADLVERFDPAVLHGWVKWVYRLDGLVGERGSTPREWRLTFWNRRAARRARDVILGWGADRLVVAHGSCAEQGAAGILADALRWV